MSTILVDNLTGKTSAGSITVTSEGGAATQSLQQGLAKAWVNFNGSGTIATRDSFGVSSLTDNGAGDYSVNFSSSFGNADYSMGGWCGFPGSRGAIFGDDAAHPTIYATGVFRLRTSYVNGTNGEVAPFDVTYANEIFHGDLA